MIQHLQSKTVAGMLTLLAVIVGLALMGKLTQEAVEAIKWLGTSYMGVRCCANVAEGMSKPPTPPTTSTNGE